MKRVLPWLLAMALPFAASVAYASFDEGIEYQRIEPSVPTSVPAGKVEVVELFWYGCPHCFHFEPELNKWVKKLPKNVVFKRIPAALNPGWDVHAATFYTEQILGLEDKAHDAFFDAIHKQHLSLMTPETIAAWFEKNYQVPQKKFLDVYHSFSVQAKVASAKTLVERYGVNSVPTIIIDGKYRTDASMAGGSYPNLLKVMDYLVKKEAANKEASAKQ
jgi:thiol:disulfide interchange protein DsbA